MEAGVLGVVSSALNVVGSAIKSQAALLAGQLSVNQQATAYHASVDQASMQNQLLLQQQRTVIIAVLVIGIVLFLLMILFVTR